MLGAASIAFQCIAAIVAGEHKRKLICSEVARILRNERQRRKMSMTKLAEKAGLSQQSVSYVERELRVPNLETLLRITGVLGIDLADVIAQAEKVGEKR
jgi:transcriptional regulator with XRE-family HTH domain